MSTGSTSVCLAALAVVVAASGAAAQIVVLEARGPSAAAYPQGSVLSPGRMIALKAGDHLEVIDASGSHVLNGPAMMPAGQVDTGSKAALQDIFRRANASRPTIAAVRGFSLDEGKAPPVPDVPPLWRLDVKAWQQNEPMDYHNFCVAAGHAPVLTRSATADPGTLEIYKESTKTTRSVTWPAGARDLTWPQDLTWTEGELFALNLDAAGGTEVRWRTVPASATSVTALAESLLDNGCYDQLDSLQSQVNAK